MKGMVLTMNKHICIRNDCKGKFSREIIEAIMESRGVKDIDEFLNPSLEKHLLPLDDLKNVEEATDIIISGLKRGDLFGIYADV